MRNTRVNNVASINSADNSTAGDNQRCQHNVDEVITGNSFYGGNAVNRGNTSNSFNTLYKSTKNIGSNNACKYNGNTIVDENEHHATNNDD